MGKAIAQASLQEDAGVVVTAAREKSEIEGLVEEAGLEKALAILADVTRRTASGSLPGRSSGSGRSMYSSTPLDVG